MLWCISFLNYADRVAVFSLFPLLEKEMHLTLVQLGLLGSAFAWVYGMCAPVAGTIVDRFSRKTAILGGLYTWSAVAIATSLSRSFWHLSCFMAADGLGETFYYPAAMSMISDYHGPTTRSRAMGTHQTSVYMGGTAGAFFAGVIGQHYGWRWSLAFIGSTGILLGFVLSRLLREPKRGAADFEEVGLGRQAELKDPMRVCELLAIIWRTPTVLILMGAYMCANFVNLILISWMPKFLYDKFHLSLAIAGLSATIFAQSASMIGSPFGGWFADLLRRHMPGGRMLVQAIAVLCGAPFVMLCGRARSVVWVIVALAGWGLFKGLYESNIFASLFDVIPPEGRGTAAGFMNMVGWLAGGSIAPLLVGFIAERRNLGVAISLAAIAYIAAACLLFVGILVFVRRDADRIELRIRIESEMQRTLISGRW